MTPNKNLETFEKGTSTVEAVNGYGILLQPFNYDSNDPDNYILAPEAAYLKKLILAQNDLVLGIDIHTPFGIGVIAGPDDSVAENNRYLIAEAENTRSCLVNLSLKSLSQQCQTGLFGISHSTISGGTEN